MNPLRHMAIDAKMAKVYTLEPPEDKEKIPIVGFNPVQELINILRVLNISIVIITCYMISVKIVNFIILFTG